MKLYEISDIYNNVLRAIDDEELTYEDMAEAIDVIEQDFEDKADSIACIVKDLDGDIKKIDEERKKLYTRQKACERNKEWLKAYLKENMQAIGMSKIKTARNIISFRKSKSLKIDDERRFFEKYPEYCNREEIIKVDKMKVKQLIGNGENFDGAEVIEKENIQIR